MEREERDPHYEYRLAQKCHLDSCHSSGKTRRHQYGMLINTQKSNYSTNYYNTDLYVQGVTATVWNSAVTDTTHSTLVLFSHRHQRAGLAQSIDTQNTPSDGIKGFIEVWCGRIQHNKTSVAKVVKPITVNTSDRSSYPDNRHIIRDIWWREGGGTLLHRKVYTSYAYLRTYARMHGAECSIKHFLTENAHNSWVLPSKVLQKRDGHVGYNPRGCQLQEAENGTGG